MIDIFESIEESEPITMSKTEYIEKAKKLIEYIATEYNRCWQSRALKDNEYPDESICGSCKGCGTFGDDLECVQDHEQGQCYHRFANYESFGQEIEATIEDCYELLLVDEII